MRRWTLKKRMLKMTDRFNTLTVVLEEPMREDDAQKLIDGIRFFKGVLDVKGDVACPADYMALTRIRNEIGTKIFNVIYPTDDG